MYRLLAPTWRLHSGKSICFYGHIRVGTLTILLKVPASAFAHCFTFIVESCRAFICPNFPGLHLKKMKNIYIYIYLWLSVSETHQEVGGAEDPKSGATDLHLWSEDTGSQDKSEWCRLAGASDAHHSQTPNVGGQDLLPKLIKSVNYECRGLCCFSGRAAQLSAPPDILLCRRQNR